MIPRRILLSRPRRAPNYFVRGDESKFANICEHSRRLDELLPKFVLLLPAELGVNCRLGECNFKMAQIMV